MLTWKLFFSFLELGKASEAFKNGGVLGYKDKEVFVRHFLTCESHSPSLNNYLR